MGPGADAQQGIYWPRKRWLATLPEHAAFFRSLPAELDRAAVASRGAEAIDSPAAAVDAFLATMAWGHGRVGYGPFRTARALRATPMAADRLHRVALTVRADGALAG